MLRSAVDLLGFVKEGTTQEVEKITFSVQCRKLLFRCTVTYSLCRLTSLGIGPNPERRLFAVLVFKICDSLNSSAGLR